MGRILRRDALEAEDRDADLSEDEHAWWAARDGVSAVPRGHQQQAAEDSEEPESHFSDYWTAESLFETPPPGAATGTDADEMTSMDLDEAHLVLQVPIGAEWEDITTAHKRLAKLYHPDRLVELSDAAQQLGRGRMAEINAAHAALRTLHFR
jgi:hypothetical protein